MQHDRDLEIINGNVAKTDHSLWSKRTGYPQHLAGSNFRHLSNGSRLADKDEQELQHISRLVELLVEKCVTGLATLDLETRRWLRSAKRSKADVRPLLRLQNPESQLRYASYWKRFICYVMRIVQRQAEHERRDYIRQARIASSQQDRTRGASDGGSISDTESSNAGSDSDGSSNDNDSDSSTSNDITVYTGEEQEGATTNDYIADACRLFL